MKVMRLLLCICLMSRLGMVTINARGLSSEIKFKKIQELTNNVDILAIQETYWDNKRADVMKKIWDGECYCNNDEKKKEV